MKLKLTTEKDIALLDVLEDVTAHNVDVLRAGIAKLLRSGRNKIIVNLAMAKNLNVELLTDIIKFNAAASELGGRILLVGQGELVLRAARARKLPAELKHYATREAALGAMAELGASSEQADWSLGGDPNGRLKQQRAQLHAQNLQLKTKASALTGLDELRELRRENGALKARLAALNEQLAALKTERRPAFHHNDTEARERALERALASFLREEGLVAENG